MAAEELDSQSQAVLDDLMEEFTPLTERLTSDVEPATVYHPHDGC